MVERDPSRGGDVRPARSVRAGRAPLVHGRRLQNAPSRVPAGDVRPSRDPTEREPIAKQKKSALNDSFGSICWTRFAALCSDTSPLVARLPFAAAQRHLRRAFDAQMLARGSDAATRCLQPITGSKISMISISHARLSLLSDRELLDGTLRLASLERACVSDLVEHLMEVDRHPFAVGGAATVENLCGSCSAHDKYTAVKTFGAAQMAAKRAARRARKASKTPKTRKTPRRATRAL